MLRNLNEGCKIFFGLIKRKKCFIFYRANFTVDVQRYVPAQVDKNKHIINITSGGVDKIEFRKGSNKNISLMLPNSE